MAISNSASGFRPGVCTSTTRPQAPYNGQVIYETDTKRTLVWEGSAWVMLTDADQPPGLQLVGSTTVSSATNGVVDNCFSSDFRNYLLTVSVTGGTPNSELAGRLRVGTTSTTANYRWQAFGALGSSYNGDSNASDNKFPVTFIPDPPNNATSYFIGNPNINTQTTFAGDWLYDDTGSIIVRRVIGRQQSTSQFTGVELFSSNSWTGVISVYGYRN